MKSWVDRLKELPVSRLEHEIGMQKQAIKIKKRDLETMEKILAEKRGEVQLRILP